MAAMIRPRAQAGRARPCLERARLGARRAAARPSIAHAVGAKLLLDGCQAVPRMPVDVAALDCDFYVFSGHKLYGPTGIGVLWARGRDARGDAALAGRRRDDRQGDVRAHHLRAAAGAVRGGDAARRRRDRAPCRDRLCRRDRPRRDRRARGGAGARDARRAARRSTASACSGRRTAPASSASRSRGCIRTMSAPYWTRAGWRSAPGIIAPSR